MNTENDAWMGVRKGDHYQSTQALVALKPLCVGWMIYNGQDKGQYWDLQRAVGARITSNSWGSNTDHYDWGDCYMTDMYAREVNDTLQVFTAGT